MRALLNFLNKEALVCLCVFRDAPEEDLADPQEGAGPEAPVAAGQAAVERLQRAAQQEDHSPPQGHPSPPKRPFRTPNVPSLCALATRATVHLMTGGMFSEQYALKASLCVVLT